MTEAGVLLFVLGFWCLFLGIGAKVQEREGGRRINLRSWLYFAARLLGDIRAVRHHRIVKRIEHRIVGRFGGKAMGRLFR